MSRVQLAKGHGREYETIYILRPNTEREIADDVANRVSEAIKGQGGLLTQAELWGSRRLAYPIKRHFRGTYVYVKYLGRGPSVAELERQLRLNDAVIRFQTIQLRNNVPLGDIAVNEEDTKLDFDLPFEADEPEVTRERELGLDAVSFERKRRSRDDDRGPAPEAKPEAKTEAKAEGDAAKPDAKAEAKAGDKAEAKADDKADAKADDKAEAKADDKAGAKADDKAGAKADDKAEAKADDKAEAKADAKPKAKADAKPKAKADAKPKAKADAKPKAKADAKPKAKAEEKTEAAAEKPATEEGKS
jgi:small subunit ribosomal protein S6